MSILTTYDTKGRQDGVEVENVAGHVGHDAAEIGQEHKAVAFL